MTQVLAPKDASIEKALSYLRRKRPLRAEEACRDYLREHPGCTDHLRLLSLSLMQQDRAVDAEKQIRFALSLDPNFPQLHEDLGSALAMQSKFDEAIPCFEKALQLQPALPVAQSKLARALAIVGRDKEAQQAYSEHVRRDPERTAISDGAQLQAEDKHDKAIEIFQSVLKKNPNNVNAMRHLALSFWHDQGRFGDAEALLRRAVSVADDFYAGWLALGSLLGEMSKHVDAIEAFGRATELQPNNPEGWVGLGNANGRAMYPDQSIKAFEQALSLDATRPQVFAAYAWELKTIGDQPAALEAYRNAIRLNPSFGPAYWSMANLKIFKFDEAEIASMLEQVEKTDIAETDDIHIRFALGKAMEDKQDYEQAWTFYDTGNQRQRMTVEYDPAEFEKRLTAIRNTFTEDLLHSRSNVGYDVPDPIFIVGLPRSGSTLIEQILASHSQVEGTSELPVLGRIVESIGRYRNDDIRYPEAVDQLRDRDFRAYGKQYIDDAKRYRQTDKPLFTDKLPNNFPMLGFASIILPNAKFINARRHPFDTCLGAYKQLFGQGQNFTYDMLDLAHYYQQYDKIMKHWHQVMPGRVLDVHYEETVTDLEGQVRRILDHCGLSFEDKCTRYYETDRAVKTASSEQVRQPIYTSALGKWRRYERHIELWQNQLGYIVDELPDVSRNAGLA